MNSVKALKHFPGGLSEPDYNYSQNLMKINAVILSTIKIVFGSSGLKLITV